MNRKSCLGGLEAFALLICVSTASAAVEPIQLAPYPQKIRTFYNLTDSKVPPALLTNSTMLPVGQITASARATDGAIWLGTTQGLLRLDLAAAQRDRTQYLAGKRYLPDDDVQQLIADDQGGIWVRTKSGVSHIEFKPMTLAQKAEVFEKRIRDRHDRYGLVASSHFKVAGDPSSNVLDDSDNDGLWTAIYAAAECFRYAVTQSPDALAYARKSIEAILFLEEVAGKRGFPARSYVRKGDPMPQGGEWHWTSDGQYYWKGDTSSDEIVGHFFIYGIAYDILPDAELKKRITQTAARIMDLILDHGYYLVDLDGKPTTWGYWAPERLKKETEERALNSLQLLSFLKTTAHITGKPRYEAEYKTVAWELKYADWITHMREWRTEMNYSDEELAMLPFYCAFRYETDPKLLQAYRKGVDEWWANIQREACPLWTFIYLTGQPEAKVDLAAAVWTLYRMPIETIEWSVHNSHRQDLVWASGADRFGRREVINLLPPDERPVMKWNSNPFNVDGGDAGRSEDDGAAFLLPYWMGRYYKFIVE